MIRPETVTIVIYPSGADADALTVSDAMQQVLDTFALLTKAEAQKAGAQQVVWRLERASTNSPLTVSAIAVAADPAGDVDQEAHFAKAAFGEGLHGLLHARERASWIDREAELLVRRILKRNLNGIGRTDIRFDNGAAPIVIDHPSALRATNYLELIAAEAAALVDDLTRTEYGAVEGDVLGLTKHYRKPAFVLRTRLSGKIVKCVLTDIAFQKVGSEHAWKEAWTDQRVLVRGSLHYDSAGDLVKVDAEDVEKIASPNIRASELRGDTTQPDRISPKQHLARSWGGSDA